MKTNHTGQIVLTMVLVICIGVLAFLVVPGMAVTAKSRDLVGSWYTHTTVINQNAEFPSLLTFTSDGAVLADETPALYETSGHGSWVDIGNGKAAFTFIFLIGSENPGKWLKGSISGTAAYRPKTDQWSGPFSIHLVDQDGNEVLSDTGTMSGMRINAGQ